MIRKFADSCWRFLAAPLAALALLAAAGCSEGTGAGAGPTVSTPGGLEESEIAEITKTAKGEKAIMAEIRKKTMENEGFVVPTKTSGKATKKRR